MLKNVISRSLNRERLIKRFHEQGLNSGCIFLSGGTVQERYDTDTEIPFRQESNFFYLTGLAETPHAAMHLAINVHDGQSTLFVPKLGGDYSMWCGNPPSLEEYKAVSHVHHVRYTQDVKEVLLSEWGTKKIYTLRTVPQIIDELVSSAADTGDIVLDKEELYRALTQIRLRKTEQELEVMRKCASISALAHVEVMKACRPGINESELEAVFQFHTRRHGCKHMAYTPIVAADDRGATLHYNLNNGVCQDGGLLLIDAGAELDMYAADITRTFPVNGKFTQQQRDIYNIVLKANKEVITSMKPGVDWTDMHRLAERIIAEGLLELGILRGSLEEVLASHVQAVFFPHGLGHSIGLDVHDPPNRDGSFEMIDEPGIRYLRIRCVLEEGMVLTVEPGIYFNKQMLDDAREDANLSKYVDWDKIKEYVHFGGVRIEDDVVVTKDGVEVLTHEVPKEIDEIEKILGAAI